MSASSTELNNRPSSTGGDDDTLDHLYCETNHDLSLCGTDISDIPEVAEIDQNNSCVVCIDLAALPMCTVCRKVR